MRRKWLSVPWTKRVVYHRLLYNKNNRIDTTDCLKIRRPITMSRLYCRWVVRTPATTLCSSSSWWVESRRQSCVSSKRLPPHTNRGHRWVESYSALFFSSITADNKNRINRLLSGWPQPRITWGQCRKESKSWMWLFILKAIYHSVFLTDA